MLIPPEIMSLTKVADNESSRYALGGIRFERDKEGRAHAVATDGRRLMHVTWNEESGGDFPKLAGISAERVDGFETILSSADCAEAAKLVPKKSMKPILLNVLLEEPGVNGTVKYAGTDLERKRVIETRTVEGRYPRWRDVFTNYCRLTKAEVCAFQKLFSVLRGDLDETAIETIRDARELVAKEDEAAEKQAEHFKKCDITPLPERNTTGPLSTTICVDAGYLAELCQVALKAAESEESRTIDLVVPLNWDKPLVLERKGTKAKAEAVLMPCVRS